MNMNVGSIDRIVRALIGLALITLVFVGPETPWGWIGLVLVGTALAGWCPLYRALGMNTCRTAKS